MSGEMKGLRGEDVVCSRASMWCLVLDANIKFDSLNVVKPTFYFFIYLFNLHDLSVLNGHFNSTQQQQFSYEGAKKS